VQASSDWDILRAEGGGRESGGVGKLELSGIAGMKTHGAVKRKAVELRCVLLLWLWGRCRSLQLPPACGRKQHTPAPRT